MTASYDDEPDLSDLTPGELADIADKQINGDYSVQSDAITALKLFSSLARKVQEMVHGKK